MAPSDDLPYLQYFDYLHNNESGVSSGGFGQYYNVKPHGATGLVEVFTVNSNQMNTSSVIFHAQQEFLKVRLAQSGIQASM